MAYIDDQKPNFKHYCKVCKKGFMCGRALGGHMRAHGIGDENGNLDENDDEDPALDWEEKTSNKRMYQLRTNPNRLKSCRICKNCGKEFLSWKSFLEHGKCSSDDVSESLVSSSESEDEYDGCGKHDGGWSKRKRTLRTKVSSFSSNYPPSEEDDILLAKCLIQLANTIVEPPKAESEESCASASREEKRRNLTTFFGPNRISFVNPKVLSSPKGLFECKACKKVFNSHQALGGHRASHKKVKGCYAAKQNQIEDDSLADYDMIRNGEFSPSKSTSSFQLEQGPALVGVARRKSKVHECSICHRVFSSGQALGGHKRCHWIVSNSQETSSLSKFQLQDNIDRVDKEPNVNKYDGLDLNVPAWAHMAGIRRDPENPLSFEVPTYTRNRADNEARAHHQLRNDNNSNKNSNNNIVDDEADSKLKLAKLSDLKEMDTGGVSSHWLQVGFGSTTTKAPTPHPNL
ncbi:hypothetical protein ACJIZ3_016230 [Penstemon smallii]|uniref:C2H2-type domain-containing protein n=1 Tax=Penstemon smallii TaxID=265156 RepID=A0ABD3RPS3_9LAMI